jgi:hypothetical protein
MKPDTKYDLEHLTVATAGPTSHWAWLSRLVPVQSKMTPLLPSATWADVDSHYNEVIPGKLFVGDKHVAEDMLLLEAMGVTHIVSCGFEQPLQSPRFCVTLNSSINVRRRQVKALISFIFPVFICQKIC